MKYIYNIKTNNKQNKHMKHGTHKKKHGEIHNNTIINNIQGTKDQQRHKQNTRT